MTPPDRRTPQTEEARIAALLAAVRPRGPRPGAYEEVRRGLRVRPPRRPLRLLPALCLLALLLISLAYAGRGRLRRFLAPPPSPQTGQAPGAPRPPRARAPALPVPDAGQAPDAAVPFAVADLGVSTTASPDLAPPRALQGARHAPASARSVSDEPPAGQAPGAPDLRVPAGSAADPADLRGPADLRARELRAEREPQAEGGDLLILAAQRLRAGRDPAGALALIDTYLQRFPDGVQVEEALFLQIEASAARGDGRAEALVRDYLRRFPTGVYRDLVLRVTNRLGSGQAVP